MEHFETLTSELAPLNPVRNPLMHSPASSPRRSGMPLHLRNRVLHSYSSSPSMSVRDAVWSASPPPRKASIVQLPDDEDDDAGLTLEEDAEAEAESDTLNGSSTKSDTSGNDTSEVMPASALPSIVTRGRRATLSGHGSLRHHGGSLISSSSSPGKSHSSTDASSSSEGGSGPRRRKRAKQRRGFGRSGSLGRAQGKALARSVRTTPEGGSPQLTRRRRTKRGFAGEGSARDRVFWRRMEATLNYLRAQECFIWGPCARPREPSVDERLDAIMHHMSMLPIPASEADRLERQLRNAVSAAQTDIGSSLDGRTSRATAKARVRLPAAAHVAERERDETIMALPDHVQRRLHEWMDQQRSAARSQHYTALLSVFQDLLRSEQRHAETLKCLKRAREHAHQCAIRGKSGGISISDLTHVFANVDVLYEQHVLLIRQHQDALDGNVSDTEAVTAVTRFADALREQVCGYESYVAAHLLRHEIIVAWETDSKARSFVETLKRQFFGSRDFSGTLDAPLLHLGELRAACRHAEQVVDAHVALTSVGPATSRRMSDSSLKGSPSVGSISEAPEPEERPQRYRPRTGSLVGSEPQQPRRKVSTPALGTLETKATASNRIWFTLLASLHRLHDKCCSLEARAHSSSNAARLWRIQHIFGLDRDWVRSSATCVFEEDAIVTDLRRKHTYHNCRIILLDQALLLAERHHHGHHHSRKSRIRLLAEIPLGDMKVTSTSSPLVMKVTTQNREWNVTSFDEEARGRWIKAIIFHQEKHTLFGERLSDVAAKEGTLVPDCLRRMSTYLLANTDHEGVFRVNGQHTAVESMKMRLMKGQPVAMHEHPVDDVAGLLATFFRELPEPVIVGECRNVLLDSKASNDPQQRLRTVAEALRTLPEANYAVLEHIIHMCCAIAAQSDVNAMTSSNLSVIWGPNLLSCRDEQLDFAASVATATEYPRVVLYLIDNYEVLFGHTEAGESLEGEGTTLVEAEAVAEADTVPKETEEVKEASLDDNIVEGDVSEDQEEEDEDTSA